MPGDGSEDMAPREIRFYLQQVGIRRITESNAAFMPLHVVLRFPEGSLAGNLASLLLSQLLGSKLQVGHCAAFGSTHYEDNTGTSRIRPEYAVSFAVVCKVHVGVLSCPWLSNNTDLPE